MAERRGCDLCPVDVNDERAALRLQSFVWPDQTERLQRLRAAMEVARGFPVTVDAESFWITTWSDSIAESVICSSDGHAQGIVWV